MTCTELGTPARGGLPHTVGERTADGWRLNGHKLYSTGCPILGYQLVWARTAGDNPLLGYFLVPGDAPGLRDAHERGQPQRQDQEVDGK